ncbi:MAG TPA: CDP-alcohol phosphatidyltransferase family protein [Fibrobacteria bacterium]|jgi:CDP-diacylglycerol--serine O-phosphatidyltransferase|nr:CDP-alcohol phosphatidyltransferase family protein [Fibrobacteria bacterium]
MVQKRFLVPNLFTGMNFLIGIYAILLMAEALIPEKSGSYVLGFGKTPLELAAWMITWCVLLDKLDGFMAKLLKASSEFGAQFDSLADLVAFGVAPALLVYYYLHSTAPEWAAAHRPLMIASLSVYVLCAALRLARYNAVDSEGLKDWFHGLPSTFAGGFMALSVILHSKYSLAGAFPFSLTILPLLLILTGLLMVSPLYLPKLARRGNKAINALQIGNVFIGYLCGFGMVFPEYLYLLLLVYGVFGFGSGMLRRAEIESSIPEG